HKDMFTIPEARRVQMLSVGSREEAESILAQINNEEITLAQAAMQYSIDPQGRHTQGNIGWITRGTLSEPLEPLIFTLSPDVISEPVEANANWHLIKVVQVTEAKLEKLENPQTRQRAFRAYMRDRFDNYVVDLRKNDFKVTVYQDELQHQFRREAEFIGALDEQQQEAATVEERIEELQEKISTLPGQ
ncbi:MAG: peptidylprolyl isomerase, partial [Thiotrichales bacterium]